jgi:CRISPR-associated endonuclease/helicase Cas3
LGKFISRIAADGSEQSTISHLRETAELASEWAVKLGFSHTTKLMALLHDMGKFSCAYVAYLRRQVQNPDQSERGSVIHSTQGAKFIYENREPENGLLSLLAEIVANCVANHHGALADGITPDGETPLIKRLCENDDSKLHFNEVLTAFSKNELLIGGIEKHMEPCLQELNGFVQKCRAQKLDMPFMLQMLTKTLFSLLVDADRYNAYLFECKADPHFLKARPDWDRMTKQLETSLAEKNGKHNGHIDDMRRDVSDRCLAAASRSKGIYQLKVPTGGGKTLSSLRFALNHAKEHGLDRVIYVIPYLSILEQTANSIREALEISVDDETILEHHSDLVPSEDDEKAERTKLLTSRWEPPVIITTMVQFLESVFSAKSGRLRKLHSMKNAVLVFDEIQSLPIRCVHLFNEAANFLSVFGGSTILLCTATQPRLDQADRPIRLSDDPSIVECCDFPVRAKIVDALRLTGFTYSELAEFVREKHVNSTLIIVNTKVAAKSLVKALQISGASPLHLSTNMCPAHRNQVITEIRHRLSSKVDVICVSTQLIEAGVDISFECVIRDIAGLDSICQAAGRCNRHGESDEAKNVYVINIKDECLSKLPDIKCGAEITRRMFCDGVDGMDEYYRYYFYARQNEMDYNIRNASGAGTIYDLLTCNNQGVKAYKNRGGSKEVALRAAMRSASDEFYVIAPGQTSIIVPYNESEQLLYEYENVDSIKTKRRLLQRLGGYSVSLYEFQIQELRKRGALSDCDDVAVLAKGFYDVDFGVNVDGCHEFLYV